MTNVETSEADGEDRIESGHLDDARRVLIYLVVQESIHYIAIMDVLESSITDLTPAEVGMRLAAKGVVLEAGVVEARLDRLQEWRAASKRTDTSRILRYSDLLARNWRYTATPAGRQAHRFYRQVLAGTPAVREIPLASLERVVQAAEALAAPGVAGTPAAEWIGQLFVNHDALDAALVGAEDSLAGMVDRFDLSDASAAELKSMLVGYATHVSAALDHGTSRAVKALVGLQPRFGELALAAVRGSEARTLIERGALVASRGGRREDWDALLAWFDPRTGRATRFALRLVRALPGMHVNLRRLHSSSGAATSRSRALALAKACANPAYGSAIFQAALGDHSWRKLHGEANEVDSGRMRSWRDGPLVEVPELLRSTGRTGARGRSPAARDDSVAREQVRAKREHRQAKHAEAVCEVLLSSPGTSLSEPAARVALSSLLAAVRVCGVAGRRTAVRDGLGCTILPRDSGLPAVAALGWCVAIPGRMAVFHAPNVVVTESVEGASDEAGERRTFRQEIGRDSS